MRCFLLFFTFLTFQASFAYAQEPYILTTNQKADFQSPFCYKIHNRDEPATRQYTTVINLYKATFKDIFDKESIWDKDYLKSHPHVVEAIRDFQNKKRAQTLNKVNLDNKTAAELHKELLGLGFVWQTVPLRASLKKRTYWLVGGQTSKNPNHKRVVKLHIYIHKDGSLVRIKAAGVPDIRAKHPRRAAHAVKVVLLSSPPNLCKKDACQYDTSYQNEAFKVTNANQPVPKAPSPKYGLKLPKAPHGNLSALHKRKIRIVQNVIMNLAHTNLATTCPMPQE